MEEKPREDDDRKSRWLGTLLTTLCFVAPVVAAEAGGVFNILIPLPVFYYLTRLGKGKGRMIVFQAMLVALGVAALMGRIDELLVSFGFLPLGAFLYWARQKDMSPLRTVVGGVAMLAMFFIVFFLLVAAATRSNPYNHMIVALNQELDTGFSYYKERVKMTPDEEKEMAAVFSETRKTIERLLPAMAIMGLSTMVLVNLFVGNWLLKNRTPEQTTGVAFNEWRLPEYLVWMVIATGGAIIAPHDLANTIGLNALFILGGLYLIQGFAILGHLFNRWSVPRPVRILVYLLLSQTYGIIFMAGLGLLEVWVDLRGSKQKDS